MSVGLTSTAFDAPTPIASPLALVEVRAPPTRPRPRRPRRHPPPHCPSSSPTPSCGFDPRAAFSAARMRARARIPRGSHETPRLFSPVRARGPPRRDRGRGDPDARARGCRTSSRARRKDKAEPKDDHEHATDRIELSEQAQWNLGLEAGALAPRQYWGRSSSPVSSSTGPARATAASRPASTGIVTAIHAKPGETVKPGRRSSSSTLSARSFRALRSNSPRPPRISRLQPAERDRIANLVKLGTAPAADLTRQQNQVDRLTNLGKSLRRQLQLFGLTPEQVKRPRAGDVVTEVDRIFAPGRDATTRLYEVQELKVRLGEQVQAGQTLCHARRPPAALRRGPGVQVRGQGARGRGREAR